jgi:alpha-aminoadipate carrier protein LysW
LTKPSTKQQQQEQEALFDLCLAIGDELEISLGGELMPECPVCGATVDLKEDTVEGELIACADCGSELEVTGVNPFTLVEAPKEEEDWGE